MVVTFGLSRQTLGFDLHIPTALAIGFDVSVSTGGGAPYNGPYQVMPKFGGDIELETKNKTLKDNVKILKIPQFEVSNEQGGTTLIMGDAYNG